MSLDNVKTLPSIMMETRKLYSKNCLPVQRWLFFILSSKLSSGKKISQKWSVNSLEYMNGLLKHNQVYDMPCWNLIQALPNHLMKPSSFPQTYTMYKILSIRLSIKLTSSLLCDKIFYHTFILIASFKLNANSW